MRQQWHRMTETAIPGSTVLKTPPEIVVLKALNVLSAVIIGQLGHHLDKTRDRKYFASTMLAYNSTFRETTSYNEKKTNAKLSFWPHKTDEEGNDILHDVFTSGGWSIATNRHVLSLVEVRLGIVKVRWTPS